MLIVFSDRLNLVYVTCSAVICFCLVCLVLIFDSHCHFTVMNSYQSQTLSYDQLVS